MTSVKTTLRLCKSTDWVETDTLLANPACDNLSLAVEDTTPVQSEVASAANSWSSQATMRDLGVMGSANGICQEYLLSYATTPLVVWDTDYRITPVSYTHLRAHET